MKKLLSFALCGAVCLAICCFVFGSSPAEAADGDACSTAQFGNVNKGSMRPLMCILLCDGDVANSDCAEFDTNSLMGIPDVLVFELYENGTDCTAGRFEIDTTGDQGLLVDAQNTYDIASTNALSIGGTLRLVVDTRVIPTDRYIISELTLEANCGTTHNLDLMMIGYEAR